MKHPHEILNKQVYIKGTTIRVKVINFNFQQKKGAEVDVEFLDTPTPECYTLAKTLHGTTTSYKEDKSEEITGTFAFKNISSVPYATRQSLMLYDKEKEND